MIIRSRAAVALLGLLLGADAVGQARKVHVGYCSTLKSIDAAKAAGFDYVELGTTEIAALSDDEYEKAVIHIKQVGLPVPVTNLFLPAALKVTGPQIDRDQQMAYVKKAFARLARLGTEIVVFGSGGARRVPEGFPKEDAFAQLVEFGKRIAPEARAHGLTIAIEPLRREETNIINSAAEGLQLVRAIDDPNFQLMVDFYHLAIEKEDPEILVRARDHIRHLHMANPQGRVFPLRWDEYDYAPFFANLRTIGFDKRISVEASTKDFPSEAPQAIALLRRAFDVGAGPTQPSSRDQSLSGTSASSKRMADGKEWTTANLNVNISSSYCYDDAEPNCGRYGRLYTWESARRGCQSLGDGWRLPTDDEWRQMAIHYGGLGNDSPGSGKAAYTALLTGGTSGFNAVLSGNRSIDGKYDRLERHGIYWTVSESDPNTAPLYNFAKGSQALYRGSQGQKLMAASVRCIRE